MPTWEGDYVAIHGKYLSYGKTREEAIANLLRSMAINSKSAAIFRNG